MNANIQVENLKVGWHESSKCHILCLLAHSYSQSRLTLQSHKRTFIQLVISTSMKQVAFSLSGTNAMTMTHILLLFETLNLVSIALNVLSLLILCAIKLLMHIFSAS
jgi:hypothetical protein